MEKLMMKFISFDRHFAGENIINFILIVIASSNWPRNLSKYLCVNNYALPDVSFICTVLDMIAQSLKHTARGRNVATIEDLQRFMP